MQYIEGTIHDLLIFIIMIIFGGLTWYIVNKLLSSLITNQMDLGTGNHPDLDKYIWTEKQVGDDKLQKWKKFKYILKVWEDVDNGVKPIWDINYLFRTYGFYHYDKLLREERA